ncbi:hypothetical protein AUJ14_00260 [Candidatus Micrarchaeota archaeon CG1_02_55_22]|nr:MAG: hypothetical protein AUJ14_00260 [Candidatus Micrarchaeota archaeon CG1_02_55_22]
MDEKTPESPPPIPVLTVAQDSTAHGKIKEINASLDASIKDGAAFSVMAGFGDSYRAPFALALGASAAQVGLLTSIPQLLASLAQPFAYKFNYAFTNRKKFVLDMVTLHALAWPLMLFIPLALSDFKVEALIALASLYAVFGAIANPAWSSWMAELVPEEKRGGYFGKRNEILVAALLVSMIAGGVILGFAQNALFWGFGILFVTAFIARLVSRHYLSKMIEPLPLEARVPYFGPIDYFRRDRRHPMKTFTLFLFFTNFTVNVAAPFFVVYMLRDLGFDYFTFTFIISAGMVARFLSNSYWGKLTDKYGNRIILRATGILIAVVPFLWLFTPDYRVLALVEMFSGFAWAGFELATFNYIISVNSREKTANMVANHNFYNGLGIVAGAAIGSLLTVAFAGQEFFWMGGLLLVFLASGLLRLLVAAYFLPRIRDNRLTLGVSEREFFWKATAVYPTRGLLRELQMGWNIGVQGVRYGTGTLADRARKSRETIKHLEKELSELALRERFETLSPEKAPKQPPPNA